MQWHIFLIASTGLAIYFLTCTSLFTMLPHYFRALPLFYIKSINVSRKIFVDVNLFLSLANGQPATFTLRFPPIHKNMFSTHLLRFLSTFTTTRSVSPFSVCSGMFGSVRWLYYRNLASVPTRIGSVNMPAWCCWIRIFFAFITTGVSEMRRKRTVATFAGRSRRNESR